MRLGELVVDTAPLRHSREFRYVFAARATSLLAIGFAMVAVPVQVYDLTRSSLHVSLVSLALGLPMFVGTLAGGVIADRMDRRQLILISRSVAALVFAVLAVNAAIPAPQMWVIYVCAVVTGVVNGVSGTALMAATPAIVGREHLAAAGALMGITAQLGAIVGPSVGGLLIAGGGLATNYTITFVATVATTVLLWFIRPLPPGGDGARQHPLRSFVDGVRFVRHNRVVAGLLVIDMFPMVFAMPYALFPQLVAERFGGGAATVGMLYTAPAVGALLAAFTSGWTGRVAHTGRALFASVLLWGVAITGFGFSSGLWLALVLLAAAGFGDSISEILRRALLQHATPDRLQGRVSSLWLAQATVGPSLGNVEAGLAARLFTPGVAVVGGGLVCIAGTVAVALAFPALWRATLAGPSGDEVATAIEERAEVTPSR